MPRGRPKKLKEIEMSKIEDTAGPDNSVAVEKKKFAKVIFRNLLDPNRDIEFSFNGIKYIARDGKEQELPMEIVNHLNSIVYRTSHFERDGGHAKKIYEEKPRCVCQILNTYEK